MRKEGLALSFVGVYGVDFEKLQEKVRALDDGDIIKVTVRLGEDNSCVETIHVPQAMDG